MYNDWMCEVIVGLVDIGGIVDHHYLNFFFHNKNYEKGYPMIVSVYFWVNEL